MEFKYTDKGTCLIEINTSVYMSFGDAEEIRFVHVKYSTPHTSISRMFPIPLSKLPKDCTTSFGKKNIKQIRELLQKFSVGGTLDRKHLKKIGDAINRAEKSK